MEKTDDGSYVKDGKVIWEPKSEKIKESCKNRAEEFDLRRQTIEDANPCFEVNTVVDIVYIVLIEDTFIQCLRWYR